ncbi:serine/threonine-protein kinase RsbW [Anseongella ginsenosidimutans]|uniref:Serine/threonine-protein kinase RsbW n=1 Tax=Anseongella ginsenosidimutans TaxID=496056 RepID=A0A4R3KU70_9SPHI|nr:ATP-binding protein [Anseongella ginsenosidimutans]QEC51591.1 ATP-binding protein [Anseongella ginsenosidimutans]TCS88919.1 serine/threonine-protein kinase RsbW [Anseongella ginsenosidimutans]
MTIASNPESILLVDALLEKIKKEYSLDQKLFSSILVTVNEAVTNAIKHGNLNDPSKKVTVAFRRSSSGAFIFTITDEGNGFNWQQAEAGISKGGQNEEGGRGLLIMEKLADKYSFNKKGNSVALHFIA